MLTQESWICFKYYQALIKKIPDPQLLKDVGEHLLALSNEFGYYFPVSKDPRIDNVWVLNPFSDVSIENLPINEKIVFWKLQMMEGLKTFLIQ